MVDQRKAFQNVASLNDMGFHDRIFFVGKTARLVQHAVGNTDLADIMHAGRMPQVLTFLFAEAHTLRDLHGIDGDPVGMLACAGILGIHRVGDGHHRLVAHADTCLRTVQCPLSEEPGDPGHKQHRNADHIEDKPAFIVDLFFFDHAEGAFFQNILLVVIEHSQMQRVIAGRNIGISDRRQIALRHDVPVRIYAFQIVARIWILDRVVDDLGEQLHFAYSPAHADHIAALYPSHIVVETHGCKVHPVRARRDCIAIGVNDKHALVTGKEKIALIVGIVPRIGCQRTVQTSPGIQQVVGHVFFIGDQIVTADHIDTGTARHKQRLFIFYPDIIIVEIREVFDTADAEVFFQIAQTVAGHQKNAVRLGILYAAENDARTQPVFAGQHIDDFPVFDDGYAVTVRTCKDPAVRKFCDGKDHRIDQSFHIADRPGHLMIADKTQAGVSCCQDRSVRQFHGGSCPVSKASVIAVIQMLCAVLLHFNQSAAIGTDPETSVRIRKETADTCSFELLCQFVLHALTAAAVHDIQPSVRADIQIALPFFNRIDYPAFHPDRTVYITKSRLCHSQKAEAGRSKPKISLVVDEGVIDGIVEFVDIHRMEMPCRIEIADPDIRSDEHCPVIQKIEVIQRFEATAVHGSLFDETTRGHIICIDVAAGCTCQQSAVRRECTAGKYLIITQLQGAEDLPSFYQKEASVRSYRRHISFSVRSDHIGKIYFAECVDLSQTVAQRYDLHTARGPHIVIAVRTLYDAADRVGWKSFRFIDHVHDLFVDGNGKTVIVGSDPESAFIVHVQAVYVMYRFIIVHPPEFASVIPIQSGVGADPQDTVVRLRDIIGFTAGKAVVAAENCLHVVVVINKIFLNSLISRNFFGKCVLRDSRESENQKKWKHLEHLSEIVGYHFFLFAAEPVFYTPVELKRKIEGKEREEFIEKIHIELSYRICHDPRASPFHKEVSHTVSPDISGRAVIYHDIQRNRYRYRREGDNGTDAHRPEQCFKDFLLCSITNHKTDHDVRKGIDVRSMIDHTINDIRCSAHNGTADRAARISAQHRAEGIQPKH